MTTKWQPRAIHKHKLCVPPTPPLTTLTPLLPWPLSSSVSEGENWGGEGNPTLVGLANSTKRRKGVEKDSIQKREWGKWGCSRAKRLGRQTAQVVCSIVFLYGVSFPCLSLSLSCNRIPFLLLSLSLSFSQWLVVKLSQLQLNEFLSHTKFIHSSIPLYYSQKKKTLSLQ